MDKNSRSGLRSYNIIINSVFQMLTTIFMGYGIGWLIDRPRDTVIFRVIGMVVFTIIALINFIYQLYRFTTGGNNVKKD